MAKESTNKFISNEQIDVLTQALNSKAVKDSVSDAIEYVNNHTSDLVKELREVHRTELTKPMTV